MRAPSQANKKCSVTWYFFWCFVTKQRWRALAGGLSPLLGKIADMMGRLAVLPSLSSRAVGTTIVVFLCFRFFFSNCWLLGAPEKWSGGWSCLTLSPHWPTSLFAGTKWKKPQKNICRYCMIMGRKPIDDFLSTSSGYFVTQVWESLRYYITLVNEDWFTITS